jgi:general secretion pathway protein F
MAKSEPYLAKRFARLRRDNPVRANVRRHHPAQPPKAPASGFRFRQDRIGSGTLALVTRQLATLVRVMTVEESLRTIALQTERPAARRLLLSTHASVTEGYRLSDAMARQGTAFPPLYRAMIAAGESSGALPEILDRLADLLEHEQGVRSKMLTTLIYPAALSVTAIAVIIALMTFVVPRVVDQFASMGQTLPTLTRIVIFVSNLMTQWGWLILLVLALCSWIAVRSLRNPALRLKFDGALLRLPLIGRLIRDLNAARLARTLSTMIASGLPVIDGLVLTARTINNTVLREAVETMASAIREGGSLSAAMRRAAVFPPVVVNMTASGESSGKLDTMLGSAAGYLEREFNTFTSVALSLLEPAIIIIMGAVVATIVLAILLPILQINTLSLR